MSNLSTIATLSGMALQWRIDELLAERNWTAYALAKKAGLTPSAVYKLLKKGNLRHIDVDTWERLAIAFDVDLTELLQVVDG